MKLFKYKNSIINLDGLRYIEYSNTNYKLNFYFQNGDEVELYINDNDLKNIYEDIFKTVKNNA
jgi:hypothetical protein